jgi:hypothetical protein
VPREEAQRKIENVLISAGSARVTSAFSPYSGYGILPVIRQSLVSKLGYEPLATGLADTTQFDIEHGLVKTPKRMIRGLGFLSVR